MSLDLNQLETRLWAAADQLWANTGLKPSEFSNPVLGLIFLRYAEKRFHEAEARMIDSGLDAAEIEKIDYQAEGALFLPDNARFSYLLDLAEGQDLGKAVNEAMAAVEAENEELKGVLPRSYGRLPNTVLVEPGKTGEISWRFNRAGTIEIACNIPGHYESGMRADLEVTGR